LEEIKQTLIDEAIKKHGNIFSCDGMQFKNCFTEEEGALIFWYNDKSGSTRVITKNL